MASPPEQTDEKEKRSQFGLLTTQRFGPFFWTQFFGAFNDNVFRNALIIFIAFKSSQATSIDSNVLINFVPALFILPFFLLSASAGQISDKFEKSMLIRRIKLIEIIIMIFASAAFYWNSLFALLIILFFMGGQSTFFGPLKYSIIPQHLKRDELMGGNAMVSMGTFISILLGTMTGSALIQFKNGGIWVGGTVCLIALAGWWTSLKIPDAPASSPDIHLSLNPFTQTWKTIGFARMVHSVFLSVLGISWFWLLGSTYLTQIPFYTKNVLKGDGTVVTLLLTMFSVGIGLGSFFCERLSGRKVELGLVPLGSIGLSLFGIDLFLAHKPVSGNELMDYIQFFFAPGSFRILADLVLIGIFGGLYIVPLNAFIQKRTAPEYRARVIAANNILNALFMVLASLLAMLLLGLVGISIPQFFLVIAILNILVAVYIYTVVPEFTMRFLIWILSHTMYRVRHSGMDNIPDEGAAVLVSNHVSYVDALLIAGACRRPIRFVMFEPIYKIPVLHFIFKTGKAIPIHSHRTKPEVYERAFQAIDQALEEGDLICIFPEGKLTTDGKIDVFKPGIEKIIKQNPVPVIPMALKGLWGSFFSHKDGSAMTRKPSRFWSKVELAIGTPLPPDQVTADGLHGLVAELRGYRQ